MKLVRKLLCLLLIITLVAPVCACKKGDEEEVKPADYGNYGADFARDLAKKYPHRKPYTEGELGAGKMIEDELDDLGYEVKKQAFTNTSGQSSYNYYIKLEGKGFISEDSTTGEQDVSRIAIIGAHYDNVMDKNNAGLSDYDGISDNASGIGCLMTIAKELPAYTEMGFDIYIVAFGAGNDNFMGARAFYNGLTENEKSRLEVMYCIDSIYAGDKMYASSGYNSLVPGQKYKMRRKLYQAYDVAYDQMLSSINGYALYYNESGILVDLNGDGNVDVYSEVSANKSDYVVFDEANIPVVYFDSYDYFFKTMEEMKETKNLNLQSYGGQVRGTNLDSINELDPILNTEEGDILEIRINNTAFVIMESLMKGSDFGLTPEQYKDKLVKESEAEESRKKEKEEKDK